MFHNFNELWNSSLKAKARFFLEAVQFESQESLQASNARLPEGDFVCGLFYW